mmetsp:Transcript_29840/g.21591  ORF Transcript_29840/g.21591 Transcript_29840/m.21591 type:complete len:81 (-) Transcript_29840:210-452(-)
MPIANNLNKAADHTQDAAEDKVKSAEAGVKKQAAAAEGSRLTQAKEAVKEAAYDKAADVREHQAKSDLKSAEKDAHKAMH